MGPFNPLHLPEVMFCKAFAILVFNEGRGVSQSSGFSPPRKVWVTIGGGEPVVIFVIIVIMEGGLRCVEIDQSERLTLLYCEGYSFWALKNCF